MKYFMGESKEADSKYCVSSPVTKVINGKSASDSSFDLHVSFGKLMAKSAGLQ